jgi:hypothetical protein
LTELPASSDGEQLKNGLKEIFGCLSILTSAERLVYENQIKTGDLPLHC